MFTKEELAVVDALASGKKLDGAAKELLPGLKAKLDASSQAEIPLRFVAVTGWANRPKDYRA